MTTPRCERFGVGGRGATAVALVVSAAASASAQVVPAAPLAAPPAARAADRAQLLADLPREGGTPFAPGHRAPLRDEPLIRLHLGAIAADGWLLEQLRLMADGMVGHLPEVSQWARAPKSAWKSRDGSGELGWEEVPYWLKGFVPLACLLDGHEPAAKSLHAEAQAWIDAVLASQQEDGWFGPAANRAAADGAPDLWPNMPLLDALRSWREATGDPRVVPFLLNYFRFELALPKEKLLPGSWQKVRGGDNLELVHWAYDQTGEPWLLELAARLHERTVDWTGGVADLHGVNFCQGFREPAQFFVQSHEPRHLAATLRDRDEMYARFGDVPGGMFGADEVARDGHGDPRQAAEACSMVEMMQSCETLASITGDALWADRCEDVAFNSLPAAATPDWKGIRYLTAPNLAAADAADHAPGFMNGGCMVAYSPHERYRCCQHNVAHGWPKLVASAWAATRDGGVAALLHGPTTVRFLVPTTASGPGGAVAIEAQTRYPFEETIRYVVHVGAANGATVGFPLWLRVPGWCDAPTLELGGAAVAIDGASGGGSPAGRWLRLARDWRDGDVLSLRLPMRIALRRFASNGGCVAVDRGPLTYSLAIGEKWQRFGGDDRWPESEVVPTTPWNVALDLGDAKLDDAAAIAKAFTVADGRSKFPAQPWSSDAPIALKARGRRLPEWGMEHGLVARQQQSPAATSEPTEELTLIPMGCARLRISAFPLAAKPGEGTKWKAPPLEPRTSHAHDDPFAPFDGIVPKSSSDSSVPRFTFWDHLGSVEWIEHATKEPRRVATCAVYWFDDSGSGRCRVPKSWRLLWLDGATWREVAGASGYGVAKDALNAVAFTPVTTTALRLEVTLQAEVSAGLFEWTEAE